MTKAEMRTQFLQILNRTDCTDALADTFIDQGIKRSQRLLSLITQERVDVVTVGASFTGIDIPADFIKPIAVYRDTYKLRRVSLAQYLETPVGAGSPLVWTRDQAKFLLKPTPSEDDVIKVLYYGEFETFATDATETTLSAISPELFFYGGLVYAGDYFIDDRKAVWEDTYLKIVTELQAQSDDEELAGGAIVEPAYLYPSQEY